MWLAVELDENRSVVIKFLPVSSCTQGVGEGQERANGRNWHTRADICRQVDKRASGFDTGKSQVTRLHAESSNVLKSHREEMVFSLQATLLNQLGLDHTKLTFRHSGRDYSLTDLPRRVLKELVP